MCYFSSFKKKFLRRASDQNHFVNLSSPNLHNGHKSMNCQRNGFKLRKLKTNFRQNMLSIFNTALECLCYPKSGFQTNQKLQRVLTNRNAMAEREKSTTNVKRGGKVRQMWKNVRPIKERESFVRFRSRLKPPRFLSVSPLPLASHRPQE